MTGPSGDKRRRSAPAALVLGVLAGALAAVAVFPTAIPVTLRLERAEQNLAVRHAQQSASLASGILERDGSLPLGLREGMQVEHISVVSATGLTLHQEGVDLPPEVGVACAPGPMSEMVLAGRAAWAVSCVNAGDQRVVVAWRPKIGVAWEIAALVLTLSAIVGIVSALAVLRLLAPLSRVSRALSAVGAGERGVRLATTGMAELDDLVERLNEAAQAVEAREDAVLARIRVAREMARIVAHEVRNPLQSMELLTSLIASEDNETERQDLAQSIHQEIRTLDLVVDRLLRQSVETGSLSLNRGQRSLAPLIDQVIALRTPEARAQGISLERGPISDHEVAADQALVGRSIANLVLNAMQAVPPRRGIVRISVLEEHEHLCVVVEDNGPGVPAGFGDQIYEPDISGRTGGTGLGLSLVKGVMDAHGGYVEHDRSPLGGARFKARIPLQE